MVGLVERGRNRGMGWLDNICQWTDLSGDNLLHTVRDRGRWTLLTHPCSQPLRSDDGEVTLHDMMTDLNLIRYFFTAYANFV